MIVNYKTREDLAQNTKENKRRLGTKHKKEEEQEDKPMSDEETESQRGSVIRSTQCFLKNFYAVFFPRLEL